MNKKLTEYGLEELIEKKKKVTGIFIGFASVMLFAMIALVYFAITQKNYAFLAVAFGGVTPIGLVSIYIGQLNKEIKSRGL